MKVRIHTSEMWSCVWFWVLHLQHMTYVGVLKNQIQAVWVIPNFTLVATKLLWMYPGNGNFTVATWIDICRSVPSVEYSCSIWVNQQTLQNLTHKIPDIVTQRNENYCNKKTAYGIGNFGIFDKIVKMHLIIPITSSNHLIAHIQLHVTDFYFTFIKQMKYFRKIYAPLLRQEP